jgi:hypothetical protein
MLKILAHNGFLVARVGILWGIFFLGQGLIPFVHEDYCNCASGKKLHAN